MGNHFMNLPKQVQSAPAGQKTDTLVNGIAQQLQQSSNQDIQQMGEELQSLRGQLVTASQPQQT